MKQFSSLTSVLQFVNTYFLTRNFEYCTTKIHEFASHNENQFILSTTKTSFHDYFCKLSPTIWSVGWKIINENTEHFLKIQVALNHENTAAGKHMIFYFQEFEIFGVTNTRFLSAQVLSFASTEWNAVNMYFLCPKSLSKFYTPAGARILAWNHKLTWITYTKSASMSMSGWSFLTSSRTSLGTMYPFGSLFRQMMWVISFDFLHRIVALAVCISCGVFVSGLKWNKQYWSPTPFTLLKRGYQVNFSFSLQLKTNLVKDPVFENQKGWICESWIENFK